MGSCTLWACLWKLFFYLQWLYRRVKKNLDFVYVLWNNISHSNTITLHRIIIQGSPTHNLLCNDMPNQQQNTPKTRWLLFDAAIDFIQPFPAAKCDLCTLNEHNRTWTVTVMRKWRVRGKQKVRWANKRGQQQQWRKQPYLSSTWKVSWLAWETQVQALSRRKQWLSVLMRSGLTQLNKLTAAGFEEKEHAN